MDDGWLYAGMQNTDIGLAPLVNFPVCPVTDGTESKIQPGPAKASGARPGRILGLWGRFLLAGPVLGQTYVWRASTASRGKNNTPTACACGNRVDGRHRTNENIRRASQ